jgi:hypothetical protein
MHQESYLTSAIIANMRFSQVAAVAMAAGELLVGLYATGEDEYYGDGTTRWEHATRLAGTGFTVALFAIASVVALTSLFIAFVAKLKRPQLWFIPAIAIYALVFFYAWAVLSVGH